MVREDERHRIRDLALSFLFASVSSRSRYSLVSVALPPWPRS